MEEYYHIKNGVLETYTGREEVVVVPEVHTIGEGAFKGCVSLKKIVLPLSLVSIQDGAFKGCRNLEEAKIPQGVTYIGNYAFHRCHALRKVVLPSSVKELGDCVFLYCDSLTEVKMPGVKRLGKQVFVNDILLEKLEISKELEGSCICDVFNGCGRIKEISFADGECAQIPNVVEAMASKMQLPELVRLIVIDVLRMMELDGRCLLRFLTNLKHVEIPEGVESLAKSCFFDKRGILSVTCPASLQFIGSRAFRNCINLERITFQGTGIQVEKDAFKNCTSLKTIEDSNGKEYMFTGITGFVGADIPKIVQVIYKQVMGNFRISGTILLKYLGEESRVVVPEGITRIAGEAFAGNEAIDRVILPESIEEIGKGAFRDCLLLQTISFPERLWKIEAGAFENCVKLIRVQLPLKISRIEKRSFRHCVALREVNFPERLREIEESAFYNCPSIKKLQFPEALIKIGALAFYQCSGLKEIELKATIEYVGSLAFAKSGIRKAWVFGSGKKYGADIFGECKKLSCLLLEEGVKHIPDKLAYGCTALEKVMLPTSLESAGICAWEGTKFLKEWLEKGEISPILWDGRNLEGEVRVPREVRIIAGGAFYGNAKITKVVLSENIGFIGKAAWKGCRNLIQVEWPSQITEIEPEVFSGCVELTEVLDKKKQIPIWKGIGDRTFYQCRKLQEICLEQIGRVGKEGVAGCSRLKIGKVKEGFLLKERAFEGTGFLQNKGNNCLSLGDIVISGAGCVGEVYLPEEVTGIAPFAFSGNRNLTRLILPKGLKWIGEGAFFGCSALTEVEFPERLVFIGERAFEKCSSLHFVHTGAEYIGRKAFAFCSSMEKAELPMVNILTEGIFEGCGALKSCICKKVEAIGERSFRGCIKLEEFDFCNIRQIEAYAFEGCDSLKRIVFQHCTFIEEYVFRDCGRLEELYFLDQADVILQEYAFSGCTALYNINYQGRIWELGRYQDIFLENLPETVRRVYCSAFSCFGIEEEKICSYQGAGHRIKIPQGIKQIEPEVFRNITMLKEIEIPESVEYIGARAFHGTTWLEQQQKKSPMVIKNNMLLDASLCVGEVIVPRQVHMVCGWAFANGMGIERICFISQARVEEYAFRNCIFLREVVLPDGSRITFKGIKDRERELPPLAKQAVMDSFHCFKTEENGVLVECTGNISKLLLADGITGVGEGAFQDGNLLTEVIFPETVRKIERCAFSGCKWLREVLQAGNVEEIGEMAFFNCGALKRIELSEKCQKIGKRAFENCTSLEEIQIPEGVEEIPDKVFYRCHSLKKVQFPSTLKKIGKEAFAFCKNLQKPCLPENILVGERAFYGEN